MCLSKMAHFGEPSRQRLSEEVHFFGPAVTVTSTWALLLSFTLVTVLGSVVLGGSRIRLDPGFCCAILADLAMRGFAISFRTLASVALSRCFFPSLGRMRPF